MGIADVLGSISPLAGAVTGKGLLGKGFTAIEDATGLGGLFPKLSAAARNRDLKKAAAAEEADALAKGRAKVAASAAKPGMKRGGTVKKMAKGGSTASKRADGCATKGKTRGKFV